LKGEHVLKKGGSIMSKLGMIEGIGESYEMKLKGAGVTSVEGLLEACASKKGRGDLAKKTGITEKLILKWANHADLVRIKGIGGEYAELLEAAGVDTVPELAKRKPEKLLAKMVEMNEAKNLVRKMPAQKQVEGWIQQAANLPRALQY
jgi:predicted flap endonuclease-1-like 5' DNA nuclease